jgi:uncharacterized membrane protein
MIESVEGYLEQLKRELDGCDSATVQDALADAEEHLRTALEQRSGLDAELPEQEALRPILEKYGSPAEVAQAYREIEMLTLPSITGMKSKKSETFLSRMFSVVFDPIAWGALLYLLLSLITGIVYFTWAITGLSLSLSLFILIIGLPFAVLFFLSVRSIALVEGRIVEALLGVRMPRRPLFVNRDSGWLEKVKDLFLERRTWTALVYMVLQLPLGALYFTVFITLLAFSLGLIASPVTELLIDEPFIQVGAEVYHLQLWQMPFVVVGGFIVFLGTLHLAKWIGRLHGVFAKGMLVGKT